MNGSASFESNIRKRKRKRVSPVNGSVPAIRQLPLDTCSGGRDSGDGMARNLRIQYPGAVYHVMNRDDRRESIFHDDGRSSGEMTRSKATWNLCQKFGPTPSLSF